jgi:GDSL-like Lipase/Acylhydrolase family
VRPALYWLRVGLINLAFIAAILVAAELLFGAWLSGNFARVLFPVDGVTVLHDVRPLYEGGSANAAYRRDRFGLRGRYDRPSNIDILTVGGSTTDQFYLDEGETYQDRLAQRFAADGRTVSVVNAGADGQTTVGHLRAMDEWFPLIPNFRPRFILAYIGLNDSELDAVDRTAFERGDRIGSAGIVPYIKRRSAIYLLYTTIWGVKIAREARLGHGQARVIGQDASGASLWREVDPASIPAAGDERQAQRLAEYAERVTELVRRIRGFGAEAILVTQSKADYRVRDGRVFGRPRADGTIDTGSYAKMAAFNRTTLETCRALGAICVDLGGELWFDDLDYYDTVHATPRGAAKIGAYLHERLKGLFAGGS